MDGYTLSSNEPLPPSLLAMRLNWDVFLSFRGEDTRDNITGQIHAALDARQIRTFIDNVGLHGGDVIAPSLIEAIHDSAASVAVISKRYADSRWCLEELATLFQCRKLVIPVFYGVDPSHVRRQNGEFGDAFRVLASNYDDVQVNRWKQALEMVGNRSGFVLDPPRSDESHAIKMIVTRVSTELNKIPVHVAAYPVGLDSRVAQVISTLNLQDNDVRFLGMHGQPGIGKTTLAKAVYIKLFACFKRRCFIANCKETLEKGVLFIQNKLISDISLHAMGSVKDENTGRSTIWRLLSTATQPGGSGVHDNRVLVVLDDVVGADKLDLLGIQRNWFPEGSRIIVTSRDKNILLSFAYEDELYEATELHEDEALELFSYHALRRKEPTEEFRSLCMEIVTYTRKLPLAIEVFGSVLLGKRTKREWEISLEKLRRIRPSSLQDVLKLSYDELDEEHRCIFLDISCLFIQVGMNKVDAVDVIDGCGFNGEEAIGQLMKKSLLKITENDSLWMHDQVRDMGRQIVMEQDVANPGNRSRLWNYDDVVNVLTNNLGSAYIRGIILNSGRKKLLVDGTAQTSSLFRVWRNFSSYLSEESGLNMKLLEPLANLKLLQINDDVKLESQCNYIPADLRWLKWKGCPWKSLPSASLPREIRVLDLSDSKIESLWGSRYLFFSSNPVTKNLTVLNLSKCYHLICLPDLSEQLNLKRLVLEGCVKLHKIHDSLGHLTSLIQLNLRRCTSLIELPRDVSGLKNLEELNLSSCSALIKLPNDVSSLKSLIQLYLDGTAIKHLPDLFHLKKLELLKLDDCFQLKSMPESIAEVSSLKILSLYESGIEGLPDSIGCLKSLEELNLQYCKFLKAIPDSVGELKSLSRLYLSGSSITHLPDSCCSLAYLTSLSLGKCSLRTLPASIGRLSSIVQLELYDSQIEEIPPEIGTLKVIQTLQMSRCTLLKSLPESIGDLFSLSVLNLESTSITKLPDSIYKLENLINLHLNQCRSLRTLPSRFGELKSLCNLWMEETAITELPESIGMLSKLVRLYMKKKPDFVPSVTADHVPEIPMSFGNLSSLEEFDARAWNISGQIPENFNMLTSMKTLDLGYNSFHSLPSSLEGLSVLKILLLPHCKKLRLLPLLPRSLIELNVSNCLSLSCILDPLPWSLIKVDATNCFSLSSIPDLSNLTKLEELQVSNCGKLQDVPGLEYLRSLRRVYMAGCNANASTVKKRLRKATYETLNYLAVPGSEIPDWFSEETVIFSSRRNSALKSVIIGVVLSVKTEQLDDILATSPLSEVQVKILRRGIPGHIFSKTLVLGAMPRSCEDQLYLCRFNDFHPMVSLLKDGDRLVVSLRQLYARSIEVRRQGLCLVYENDDAYDGNEELLEINQRSVSNKLAIFFSSLDDNCHEYE